MALSFIDHLQFVDLGVEENDIGEELLESDDGFVDHLERWLIQLLVDELSVQLRLLPLPARLGLVAHQVFNQHVLSLHQLSEELFVSILVVPIQEDLEFLVKTVSLDFVHFVLLAIFSFLEVL